MLVVVKQYRKYKIGVQPWAGLLADCGAHVAFLSFSMTGRAIAATRHRAGAALAASNGAGGRGRGAALPRPRPSAYHAFSLAAASRCLRAASEPRRPLAPLWPPTPHRHKWCQFATTTRVWLYCARQVVLEAEVSNVGALRLYQNLGFIRDKRLQRCATPAAAWPTSPCPLLPASSEQQHSRRVGEGRGLAGRVSRSAGTTCPG